MSTPIRVMIVDDSAIVRGIIRRGLANRRDIEVVGQAADGADALRLLPQLRPDVVTLDVEMPKMNGLAVLQRAAGKVPVAFIMVSTLTKNGANVTLEALRGGAFDYITKPDTATLTSEQDFHESLYRKIRAAAHAKHHRRRVAPAQTAAGATTAPKLPPNKTRGWLVGIGISCGGPQTLYEMLPAFPSDFVPILITQHMPAAFTGPFAAQLDNQCAMHVKEAEDGEQIVGGTVYIAPGSHHLRLRRIGLELRVALDGGPKVSGHRPAADVMFESLAQHARGQVVGVVMTGMGRDGANGIQKIKASGGVALAQDEASSLVYGMPKAAFETGVMDGVVSLDDLPHAIARAMSRVRATAPVGR